MTEPFREPIDLDTATALTGADGIYATTLVDDWQLWGPSGGYLAAIALRAAGDIAELPRPVSFFCHFVRAPKFEAVEVTARFIRRGRRSESIAVELHQGGKVVLTAFVRTATDADGFEHQLYEMPAAPKPDELEEFRWDGSMSDVYTYWNNFQRKPVIKSFPAEPSDPVAREWIRAIPTASFEDPFLDASRSLMQLDTFGYLAAVHRYPTERFIAPNLDTSAWFHDIAGQTDWLLIDHASPVARDGVIAVDGRVWSEDGKLVATGSAQLLLLTET